MVRSQIGVPMIYNTLNFDVGFRLDIIVNEQVIVEVKSVEALADVHDKQRMTYLRLTDRRLCLLISFNCSSLTDKVSLVRIANRL